jgi:hypothetical protein
MVDDPTPAELWRRLLRVEDRLDGRVVGLNTYLAERTADRSDVADLAAAITALELRMEKRQDAADKRQDAADARLTWVLRAAVTGILLPLVITFAGFFFRAGG